MNTFRFKNRSEAGTALAQSLLEYKNDPEALLLALPRGGVPIAAEISRQLRIPFDLFFVRKLGLPGHEEYAVGAIASGGIRFVNEAAVKSFGLSGSSIDRLVHAEEEKLHRYERTFGTNHQSLTGKNIILVDDGLATGATMKVAVRAVRQKHPAKVVVAVPVGSEDSCANLATEADEIICPLVPEDFQAVGQWYQDFRQVTDEEVLALLPALHR